MWFNNAFIYQCEFENSEIIEESLFTEKLKSCPPHAHFIYGWSPVFEEALSHQISGCTLICMGKEERILPRNVIQKQLVEHIEKLEAARGYKVKRTERVQLAEEIEFELLPKAFCVEKKQFAILDHKEKYLIINTSSPNQASQFISLLKKSLPKAQIQTIPAPENLVLKFTHWLSQPHQLPSPFSLGADCLLFSHNDENKRFSCKGYDSSGEEIITLIDQGLIASEISMVWSERIQFTLTQDFKIKRIKILDYLVDEFHEIHKLDELQQRDATLTLLIGELRSLIKDIFKITTPTAQGNKVLAEALRV